MISTPPLPLCHVLEIELAGKKAAGSCLYSKTLPEVFFTISLLGGEGNWRVILAVDAK